ncbi:3-hydroxyacyl-CoA dehydrogenase family protein [Desulfovirgula thermocuniculi]|uniref:3-hydroxyacyl-CoA dehydrogenase family protein n=1 Tax=Desulfovirgula thermocuniculi TaxID=348842 RepID=UPI0004283F7B|nr:3-hydroxyacyl-CoA dehydrogenase family protein [Desulfovirgula thermocuniculi]
MEVKKVGVIGAGTMGGGIAHLVASSGFEVLLCDVEQRFLDGALKRMADLMDKRIEKNKMTKEEKDAILGRIKTTTNLDEFAAADYVIEAVIEDVKIKKDVFARLDNICRKEVILATNTSSISITDIASATKRADKVVGMHFFNPPQVMRLVEVVRGYYTSDETVKFVKEMCQKLGKTPIEVKKDSPGFVVNRLMLAQYVEAMKLLEEGVATVEDIDIGVKLGLNHPMGVFELQDFGGLDIGYYVLSYLCEEFKDGRWNPPTSLKVLIRAGRLGRKTGAGWYDYQK